MKWLIGVMFVAISSTASGQLQQRLQQIYDADCQRVYAIDGLYQSQWYGLESLLYQVEWQILDESLTEEKRTATEALKTALISPTGLVAAMGAQWDSDTFSLTYKLDSEGGKKFLAGSLENVRDMKDDLGTKVASFPEFSAAHAPFNHNANLLKLSLLGIAKSEDDAWVELMAIYYGE